MDWSPIVSAGAAIIVAFIVNGAGYFVLRSQREKNKADAASTLTGSALELVDEMKDQIMHISLPISKETVLMGSDAGGEWAPGLKVGNNFSISVNTDTTEEVDRIFNALAEGGNITMPVDKTFWGSYFGMLTDKFGISWMVGCELEAHKNAE